MPDQESSNEAKNPAIPSAESKATVTLGAAQSDADALRAAARQIEQKAMLLSDEAGGSELDQQARVLRKQAQRIEERLPA